MSQFHTSKGKGAQPAWDFPAKALPAPQAPPPCPVATFGAEVVISKVILLPVPLMALPEKKTTRRSGRVTWWAQMYEPHVPIYRVLEYRMDTRAP